MRACFARTWQRFRRTCIWPVYKGLVLRTEIFFFYCRNRVYRAQRRQGWGWRGRAPRLVFGPRLSVYVVI